METCSICLDEIKDKQLPIQLSCNHKFHFTCFKKYVFKTKHTFFVDCPNCRQLNNHLESIKYRLNSFLKIPANQPKLIWTRCNNYHTYLKSLDTTSLTYPINSTWEKYCSDNSIVYMSSLQIC